MFLQSVVPVGENYRMMETVFSLSPLNTSGMQTNIRIETVAVVYVSIRKESFILSVDLKDGYFASILQIKGHISYLLDSLNP